MVIITDYFSAVNKSGGGSINRKNPARTNNYYYLDAVLVFAYVWYCARRVKHSLSSIVLSLRRHLSVGLSERSEHNCEACDN